MFVLLVLGTLANLPAAAAAAPDQAQYLIQPGDVLDISVWNEENLAKQVLVRPDGGISFPLAGDLKASGLSIAALQEVISAKLEKFIPDPLVTVATNALNGNKIYVIGKVTSSGGFVATGDIDVVQALSLAGGMTPYAATNKILVLRRVNGKLISIPFRYGDIEKGKNLQQNIVLQSGDVVLVP